MHICPSCSRSIPDARYCPYCAAEQIPQQPSYNNQSPYFNGNQNNRSVPAAAAPYGGFGPAQPAQRQQMQQPKKNAVIVDENDFIIYDAAPQLDDEKIGEFQNDSDKHDTPLQNHKIEQRSEPIPSFDADDGDPDRTRIYIRPAAVKQSPEQVSAVCTGSEPEDKAEAAPVIKTEDHRRLTIDHTQPLTEISFSKTEPPRKQITPALELVTQPSVKIVAHT